MPYAKGCKPGDSKTGIKPVVAMPTPVKIPSLAKICKLMKANPDLAHLAPHIAGGIKVVEYGFNVLDAAALIPPPQGVEIVALEFRANSRNKKASGEVECANWIIETLKQRVGL